MKKVVLAIVIAISLISCRSQKTTKVADPCDKIYTGIAHYLVLADDMLNIAHSKTGDIRLGDTSSFVYADKYVLYMDTVLSMIDDYKYCNRNTLTLKLSEDLEGIKTGFLQARNVVANSLKKARSKRNGSTL